MTRKPWKKQAEWVKANRAKGLCRCGQPTLPGKCCDKCKRAQLDYLARLRQATIEAYGGKCQCPSSICPEANPDFLTVDHVNNDGGHHRKNIGRSINLWLKRNNYPTEGFRLMCWNCNVGRARNHGVCPHEEEVLARK